LAGREQIRHSACAVVAMGKETLSFGAAICRIACFGVVIDYALR
jgi:hypothetical protein